MPALIDLTGRRIGRWQIIGRAPNSQGSFKGARWFAKCDCGTEAIVQSGHLQSGHTASCGCLARERQAAARVKQMVGRRFGRLVVIAEGPRHSPSNRKVRWVVRCDCGAVKTVIGTSLRVGATTSCGCLNTEKRRARVREWGRGASHPGWKSGRTKSSRSGYVSVTLSIDDPLYPYGVAPLPGSSTRRMLEHRYVMAQVLGRPLTPRETVHHKNGIRDDNRIENLELWSSSHPPGQRIRDLQHENAMLREALAQMRNEMEPKG